MFYIESPCPICEVGIIAFCRCVDNVTLSLACKDCNAMWPSPDSLQAVHALFAPHAAMGEEGECRWASVMEIELRGWADLICGELVCSPARTM